MNVLEACDELTAFVRTAAILVSTHEEDPDNYSAIKEHLEELASDFKRMDGED